MDHAVNRPGMDHEMSTDGRGTIPPAERGGIIYPAQVDEMPTASNAFMEPDSMFGEGGCDPSNGV